MKPKTEKVGAWEVSIRPAKRRTEMETLCVGFAQQQAAHFLPTAIDKLMQTFRLYKALATCEGIHDTVRIERVTRAYFGANGVASYAIQFCHYKAKPGEWFLEVAEPMSAEIEALRLQKLK